MVKLSPGFFRKFNIGSIETMPVDAVDFDVRVDALDVNVDAVPHTIVTCDITPTSDIIRTKPTAA